MIHSSIASTLIIGLLLVATAACAPRSAHWTEEVELTGGEVILVARRERYRSNTEFGGGYTNVWIDSARAEVTDSNTAPVSPPPLMTGEREFLTRLDFDPATRQWYAISAVQDCRTAQRVGLIDRPYFEYLSNGTSWRRQPVSEQRIGVTANMLIKKSLANEADPVKLDAKRRADSNVSLPNHLKRVLNKVPC
jgi:hypothetical protein